MTRVRDSATVRITKKVVPLKHRRRARAVSRRLKAESTKAPREVMQTALRLARGDRKRLRINKDGSVTVLNPAP